MNGRPSEKTFPVKLLRHYVPIGEFEVLGHHKPRIERKDAAGRMIVVDAGGFVPKEPMPAPMPGAGYPNKVWAGTEIRLPIDEAKKLIDKKIAERADAIAA